VGGWEGGREEEEEEEEWKKERHRGGACCVSVGLRVNTLKRIVKKKEIQVRGMEG